MILYVEAASRYDLTSDQMATTSLGFGFNLGSWEYKLNQEYLEEKVMNFLFQQFMMTIAHE